MTRASLCRELTLDMELVVRRTEDALVLGLVEEQDGLLRPISQGVEECSDRVAIDGDLPA